MYLLTDTKVGPWDQRRQLLRSLQLRRKHLLLLKQRQLKTKTVVAAPPAAPPSKTQVKPVVKRPSVAVVKAPAKASEDLWGSNQGKKAAVAKKMAPVVAAVPAKPRPVARTKPVVRVKPKPVVRPEPRPVVRQKPKEAVYEEPKPVARPKPIPKPKPRTVIPTPPPPPPPPPPTPVGIGGKSGIDDLLDDDEPVAAPKPVVKAAPPPPPPPPPPTPVVTVKPEIVTPPTPRSRTPMRAAKPSEQIGDGLMDDGEVVSKDAINKKVAIHGGGGQNVSSMSKEEITDRIERIGRSLKSTQLIQRKDADFLRRVGRRHPKYNEANRLLGAWYFRNKNYKLQAKALEAATKRGRYKHDPRVLLSLAKAYGRQERHANAVRVMKRVERKFRRLPAREREGAIKFHAEMLEQWFLRQYNDERKKANMSLLSKAIRQWENYRTFVRGAKPGQVAKASATIKRLKAMKKELEL